MSGEYHLMRRLWRWVRQFRHRCGYGVHSPLAFGLITDVIYNADAYYAYERLRRPLVPSASRLDEYDPESGLIAKDLRLLFRLVNWQEPSHILHNGRGALPDYLHAARPSARLESYEAVSAASPLPSATGAFRYCDAPHAIAPLQPGDMVVVRGIHPHDGSDLWEKLKTTQGVVLSFDLGRFGILLNRPKMNVQHYVVNYF